MAGRIIGQDGSVAKVTKSGRVCTEAVTLTEDHEAALSGDAYHMDIDNVSTDGANYWLVVIKNTDDDDLIVTSVTLWVGEYSDSASIEAYLGSTFTYASNGTAVVPCNLRSGVTGGAEGEFYVNDGAGNITTITAGSIAGRYIFHGADRYDEPTAWINTTGWIIPKNQTFMLWSDKAHAFRGYISFYYHRSCDASKKISG